MIRLCTLFFRKKRILLNNGFPQPILPTECLVGKILVLGTFGNALKGVLAKNERDYRCTAKNKRI